jgi:hypothetical protein
MDALDIYADMDVSGDFLNTEDFEIKNDFDIFACNEEYNSQSDLEKNPNQLPPQELDEPQPQELGELQPQEISKVKQNPLKRRRRGGRKLRNFRARQTNNDLKIIRITHGLAYSFGMVHSFSPTAQNRRKIAEGIRQVMVCNETRMPGFGPDSLAAAALQMQAICNEILQLRDVARYINPL